MILYDTNIYDVVMVIWGSLLLIALLIACVTYYHIQNRLRKDYIKNLNEHDKAVILEYEASIHLITKNKKENKKDEQNKNM